jgi:large subunit ribosomal protein L13
MNMNSSFVPKEVDRVSGWRLVDAKGEVLGRLATKIAMIIRGKDKPVYTPSADMGDYVIVINAADVVLTGDKWAQKVYKRHSMYPGGLTETLAKDVRKRFPERIIEHAVFGMLPKGNLGHSLRGKLRVYAGPTHPHHGQMR